MVDLCWTQASSIGLFPTQLVSTEMLGSRASCSLMGTDSSSTWRGRTMAWKWPIREFKVRRATTNWLSCTAVPWEAGACHSGPCDGSPLDRRTCLLSPAGTGLASTSGDLSKRLIQPRWTGSSILCSSTCILSDAGRSDGGRDRRSKLCEKLFPSVMVYPPCPKLLLFNRGAGATSRAGDYRVGSFGPLAVAVGHHRLAPA